jgi:hypothetical protein
MIPAQTNQRPPVQCAKTRHARGENGFQAGILQGRIQIYGKRLLAQEQMILRAG